MCESKKIKEMTLHEKASLLCGYKNMSLYPIPHLNIRSLTLSDGPNGLRVEKEGGNSLDGISNALPSTCFPSGVNFASTWNRDLIYKVGQAIGDECLHYGINVVLGPAINIKRNPLCGRNFEYFSEDPYLAGELGTQYVLGVQDKKVGCCLKHFACNNNEKNRFSGDSILDPRALHEIYLKPFEKVVKKAKPYAIMSAYNKVNGVHCSENGYLLNDILRKEWKFDGLSMTDWGGIVSRDKALVNGTDLEMPGQVNHSISLIEQGVENKTISESIVDESVLRILNAIEKTNAEKKQADFKKNYDFSMKVAQESAVLLKNENHILPLKKDKKYIVIGDFFRYIRYQGSGSALLNPYYLYSHKDIFDRYHVNYEYYQGFKEEETKVDEKLENEVLSHLKDRDEEILFFGGLNDYVESEGFDRENTNMPRNQISLLEKLLKMKKKIVLILHSGSVITEKVLDDVDAVLDLLLPGEAGAEACYHLLFGDFSPCGRLAETWMTEYQDVPFYDEFTKTKQDIYKESIFVGYRYYLSKKERIRYPFGYGLSYASFEYSSLEYERVDNGYRFSFIIKNNGDIDSYDVPQIYVSHDSELMHPEKELKGFEKVYLKAKEEKKVSIFISDDDLKIYDVTKNKFILEEGEYKFSLGRDVLDILLSMGIKIDGEKIENIYSDKLMRYYLNLENLTSITNEEYEELLGYHIPEIKKEKKITFETPIGEMKTPFGKLFLKVTTGISKHLFKKACKIKDRNLRERKKKAALFVLKMIPNNSLRSLCYSSSGALTYPVAQGIIEMCNHHYIKGVHKMLKKDK